MKRQHDNDHPDVLNTYSGGIDSTFALYLAKKKLNLNVVALKLRTEWEIDELCDRAEQFCRDLDIPLVTIHANSISMFCKRSANIASIGDEEIFRYPWCRLCSGTRGSILSHTTRRVAEALGTYCVITGNNTAQFESSVHRLKNPRHEVDEYYNSCIPHLTPTSILSYSPTYLSIPVAIALGYDRRNAVEMLSKAGYSLPRKRFDTPPGDCEFAQLYYHFARWRDKSTQLLPTNASYGEFLSGYRSREDWMEMLLRVNTKSHEDSKRIVKHVRKKLSGHERQEELRIEANESFLRHLKHIDIDEFISALLKDLQLYVHRIHSYYYFDTNRSDFAVKEIQRFLQLGATDVMDYLQLAACCVQNNERDIAIEICKEAERAFPESHRVSLYLSRCYRGSGKTENSEHELDKVFSKHEKRR
jgi:tetratricopeptide (TPR) repeat protein